MRLVIVPSCSRYVPPRSTIVPPDATTAMARAIDASGAPAAPVLVSSPPGATNTAPPGTAYAVSAMMGVRNAQYAAACDPLGSTSAVAAPPAPAGTVATATARHSLAA